MTDEIIIDGIDVSECKYKIQSSENFNTQPYCSILNKFCEEVSFVCDKNCQIYEDLKQLARAKEENEKLKEELDKYLNQEEEEIRQLNNDNKLDDILESIKKAKEQ